MFPYRRRIRFATPDRGSVVDELVGTLTRIGFRAGVVEGTSHVPGVTTIVAERNVVRVTMSAARAIPVGVLVTAGLVLGLTDWLVTGYLLVVFPWIGAFAVGAFLLRLRMGGAYLSELIMVEVRPVPASGSGPATEKAEVPSVTTLWGAGRARTEGELGPERKRVMTRAEPMIPLRDSITFVVHEASRGLVRGTGVPRA
jgi:hypothetical protein